MNYNTANGIKFKVKSSPNQKILEELNKKGITVYDKMGNAVNSPVTTVKKSKDTGNITVSNPVVQEESKSEGSTSFLHDKIGNVITSAKKIVGEQINSNPYKDILPAPKKENTTEPQKSKGYEIKNNVIGSLNNRSNNSLSKHIYDGITAEAIEKNIPAAQEAIDLNIKTGKLSQADLDKYPYLRDGLAFSYAAGESGNKKAEKAARELAYTSVDQENIMPAKWAAKPSWQATDKNSFGIKKASNESQKTRYVSDNGVRFRSAPGLNSNIIDSMNKGTSVKYTGNKTDKIDGYQWAEVEYDGKKGWVAADYLRISKPTYETTIQQATQPPISSSQTAPEELFVKSQEKDVEKRTVYLNEKIPEWMADKKYFKNNDDLINWFKQKGTTVRYTGSYFLPLKCERISQAFYGKTSHAGQYTARYENNLGSYGAVDFAAKLGEPTYAVLPGKIVYTDNSNNDYHRVTLETKINGETYYLEYLHLNEIKASLNSKVDMGTQIGTVGGWGTSGPTDYGYHLDFRIYQFINKSNKNYSDDTVKIFYDPFEFFDFDIQYNYRISDSSTHDYH